MTKLAADHKVKAARANLLKTEAAPHVDVPDERCFSGLDAYRELIHHPDVDLVIHATAPGFRPIHLAEAVAADKHSFIEKPACVDPHGYRSILTSARVARVSPFPRASRATRSVRRPRARRGSR